MKIRCSLMALVVYLIIQAPSASALTMKQVSEICDGYSGSCSDIPIVQAYVGGALDLISTLDDRTEYLKKVYCEQNKDLFDVTTIIRYMEQKSTQYANDNAMLVLIRYFEEHGGC